MANINFMIGLCLSDYVKADLILDFKVHWLNGSLSGSEIVF